jgi:hypothetical protein
MPYAYTHFMKFIYFWIRILVRMKQCMSAAQYVFEEIDRRVNKILISLKYCMNFMTNRIALAFQSSTSHIYVAIYIIVTCIMMLQRILYV